jgi:hypothetical protein
MVGTNTYLHGSARQVVIGRVSFKGEGQNFTTPQRPHQSIDQYHNFSHLTTSWITPIMLSLVTIRCRGPSVHRDEIMWISAKNFLRFFSFFLLQSLYPPVNIKIWSDFVVDIRQTTCFRAYLCNDIVYFSPTQF